MQLYVSNIDAMAAACLLFSEGMHSDNDRKSQDRYRNLNQSDFNQSEQQAAMKSDNIYSPRTVAAAGLG
jgi:hypothetical protein